MEKEIKEIKEKPKEEVKKEVVETPKGFYLAKVPTNYGLVMMKGEEQIATEDLIIQMANALEKAGLMK